MHKWLKEITLSPGKRPYFVWRRSPPILIMSDSCRWVKLDDALPVLGSSRFERSTSGQATSSGVVEGVCGVGLRAKHLFDLNLQAVLISSSSNNAYRMEACSVDAAEPLH